jgi:CelD/BcsL family acetyltransferase involved in cellulose biosynthesis
MYTWWRRYGEGSDVRALAVVVEHLDGRVSGILPGYIRRKGMMGSMTYSLLGSEFESSDYLRLLAEPGREADALLGTLHTLLSEEPGLDVLDITNVLESDPMLAALEVFATGRNASFEIQHHRVCPCIDLSVAETWDKFLAARSSNMRWKVRRSIRRLAEAGAGFSWVHDRSEVAPAVAELFALHAKRFEAKEIDSIFRADIRQPFHAEVSERLFDRGILRLFQLRANARTIAALYCFEFGGGLYYFQAGIDPEWEDHSVGLVIIAHAIQYAFDRKLLLFDFMRGGEAYKFRWTDDVRNMVVARIGVSTKGRTLLALQRQVTTAKAVVKRLVRRSQPDAMPARPS